MLILGRESAEGLLFPSSFLHEQRAKTEFVSQCEVGKGFLVRPRARERGAHLPLPLHSPPSSVVISKSRQVCALEQRSSPTINLPLLRRRSRSASSLHRSPSSRRPGPTSTARLRRTTSRPPRALRPELLARRQASRHCFVAAAAFFVFSTASPSLCVSPLFLSLPPSSSSARGRARASRVGVRANGEERERARASSPASKNLKTRRNKGAK